MQKSLLISPSLHESQAPIRHALLSSENSYLERGCIFEEIPYFRNSGCGVRMFWIKAVGLAMATVLTASQTTGLKDNIKFFLIWLCNVDYY